MCSVSTRLIHPAAFSVDLTLRTGTSTPRAFPGLSQPCIRVPTLRWGNQSSGSHMKLPCDVEERWEDSNKECGWLSSSEIGDGVLATFVLARSNLGFGKRPV